MNKCKCKHWL